MSDQPDEQEHVPAYSEADLAYVREEYATLEQLCAGRTEDPDGVRSLIEQGRLPRASYVLPDGTEMYPPDYFALPDEAGGVEQLHAHFDERYRAATSALGLPGAGPDESWRDYLSGELGVCLREVIPEAMVEKNALTSQIEALTALPATNDERWRARLAAAVDELDELERPFTDYDRQRLGVTSRDKHITAVRGQYLS